MKFIHSTSKKGGAILAYSALALNTVSSIFLTPILLRELGVEEYGLYQMIYSVGSYILILDLGISTMLVRYLSEYRAKNDWKGRENFAAMAGIIVIGVIILLALTGIIINNNIEKIFPHLTPQDYGQAHQMFVLMVIQIGVTILDNYFLGIIGTYERFVFNKLVWVLKIISVFFLTVYFVKHGFGAIGIVAANLIFIVAQLCIDFIYSFMVLKFRVRYHYWDGQAIRPAVGLMFAILLQTIVMNVNTSADKTILGMMCTKIDVAVYSIAATIVMFFNAMPLVISNMFQPTVTRLIVKNASKRDLTNLVIRVGRWQFIITGAIIVGFLIYGLDFIQLWTGQQMRMAWLIALIIMPCNMIPLVQSIGNAILNGYDKRLDRSLILTGMCVVNILTAVFLIKHIGIIGAPIATGFSYILGHGIIMNIYYSKVIHLEVKRMFKEIFSRTWVCLLLTALVCLPLELWSKMNIWVFSIKVLLFTMIYALLMFKWGFNHEEKTTVLSVYYKLKSKILTKYSAV